MLIQIRGTSGSGKTTIMRSIMQTLMWNPTYVLEGRRKPTYYVSCGDVEGIAVLGHYESVCGGCDTFKGYSQLLTAVRHASACCPLVLMEGLMLSDDVLQTVKMHEECGPTQCYYLVTPLPLCIERVKGRREAKGRGLVRG